MTSEGSRDRGGRRNSSVNDWAEAAARSPDDFPEGDDASRDAPGWYESGAEEAFRPRTRSRGAVGRNRLEGAPSTAAIIGHPIHPVLIPFPLAFLSSVLFTDLAQTRTGDPFWGRASVWLLRAGLTTGVAAGAFGAVDFFTKERARSHPVGPLHAAGNLAVLALAAVNLASRDDEPARDTGTRLALSATMTALLAVTAWAGGELVYRHMTGVTGHRDQHGR